MTSIVERYPDLVKSTQRLGPHREPDRKRSIAHWAATQNQFRTEGVLAWVEFSAEGGESWCVWHSFVVKETGQ